MTQCVRKKNICKVWYKVYGIYGGNRDKQLNAKLNRVQVHPRLIILIRNSNCKRQRDNELEREREIEK